MADSDNNVEIRITGALDPSMQASADSAKAVMADLGTSTNVSAKAMSDALKAAGGDLSKITPEMLGVQSAAATVGPAVTSNMAAAEQATSRFTGMTVRARTEVIVLAHEMVQGRFARIPGSMMVLAEAMGGVSLATWGMIGAVAAAGGGLAYMAYEEFEAEREARKLAEGFALTGRSATDSAASVAQEVEHIKDMPGSTKKAAQGFMELAAEHANWDAALRRQVEQLMPQFVLAYGSEAPKAAGQLMTALSDLTVSGFQRLDREMLNLKPDQYAHIEALIRTGQEAQATSLILKQLATQSGGYIKSEGDQVYDLQQQFGGLVRNLGQQHGINIDLGNLNQVDTLIQKVKKDVSSGTGSIQALNELTTYRDRLEEIRKSAEAAKKSQSDNSRKSELDFSEKVYEQYNKEDKQKRDLARLNADIANADKKYSADEIAAFEKARDALQAKIKAEDDAAAKKAAREAASGQKKEWTDYTAGIREQVAATATGSAERLRIEQSWADRAAEIYGRNSVQYKQAMTAVNETERAQKEQSLAISRSTATADLEILRIQQNQQKGVLDKEVAEYLRKSSELAILDSFAAETYQRQVAIVQAEIAAAPAGTLAYVEAVNRKRILDEQWKADHLKNLAEISQAENREAHNSAMSWRESANEIKSAEGTLVSGLIGGRQTLSQALGSMALQLAEKEVQADASAMTMRLLLSKNELAAQHTIGQSGLLYHMLVERQKTVASTAGSATRKGIKVGEHAVDSSIAAQSVATTATAEAAKTGAVAAGESMRLTEKASAAETGQAIEKTTHSESILMDAYDAAAGAFTSVMDEVSYPFNLILAPAAAAATFIGVMAFDAFESGTPSAPGGMALVGERGPELVYLPQGSEVIPNHRTPSPAAMNDIVMNHPMASFDVGTNYVPHDMKANIHKGERIVPAADNSELMKMVRAGASGNTGKPSATTATVASSSVRAMGDMVSKAIHGAAGNILRTQSAFL